MDKTCVNGLLGVILHCLQDRDKMTYIWLIPLSSFGSGGGYWGCL